MVGGVGERRWVAGGGFVVSEGGSCAMWELGQRRPRGRVLSSACTSAAWERFGVSSCYHRSSQRAVRRASGRDRAEPRENQEVEFINVKVDK